MVAEAQRHEDDDASTSLAKRCSDLELHRIDLTARLLALKDVALSPEALIVRTAAETRRSYERSLDAVLFIAGMIRISATMLSGDAPGRALLAAERISDLMAAVADPSAIAFLRGLRRRGELDRPPPLDTQRLLRRACWRGRPADARTPTREPLPGAAWDALLDNLARSIAIDREAIKNLERAMKILVESKLNTTQALVRLREELAGDPNVDYLIRYVETAKRGYYRSLPGRRSGRGGGTSESATE